MCERYIRANSVEGLESFAPYLFQRLNIRFLGVGDSSFYIDDKYIDGQALGVSIKLAFADDADLKDYRFCLTLKAAKGLPPVQAASLDGLAECVACVLALDGFEIARPLGFKVGDPIRYYARDARPGERDRYDLKIAES